MVGAFVHGSFIYLGEYVQALNRIDADSQPVLIEMFQRHRKIMDLSYGFLFACIIIASLWSSVLVLLEKLAFPRWMAAINPLTALLFWMALKKILPNRVTEVTEGAGFNIAYLIFGSLGFAVVVAICGGLLAGFAHQQPPTYSVFHGDSQ